MILRRSREEGRGEGKKGMEERGIQALRLSALFLCVSVPLLSFFERTFSSSNCIVGGFLDFARTSRRLGFSKNRSPSQNCSYFEAIFRTHRHALESNI